MLSLPLRQRRIYRFTGRLLATLPKLLLGNGYTAVDYINPDTDTNSRDINNNNNN